MTFLITKMNSEQTQLVICPFGLEAALMRDSSQHWSQTLLLNLTAVDGPDRDWIHMEVSHSVMDI